MNGQWTPQSMGSKGGKKSRRTLTPEQAKAMVKAREERKKNKSTHVIKEK
jgi:hypothetical protein